MVEDKDLSVVVPKTEWHKMENKIKELSELTSDLLVPGDNVIVVKSERKSSGFLDRQYYWEHIDYTDFEIKGGGQILKSVMDTQSRDYSSLLNKLKSSEFQVEIETYQEKEMDFIREIDSLKEDNVMLGRRVLNLQLLAGALTAGLILALIYITP